MLLRRIVKDLNCSSCLGTLWGLVFGNTDTLRGARSALLLTESCNQRLASTLYRVEREPELSVAGSISTSQFCVKQIAKFKT